MTAYEFQTAVCDGIINIPAEYKNKIKNKVRVIVLSNESIENDDRTQTFKAKLQSLDIPDFFISEPDDAEDDALWEKLYD